MTDLALASPVRASILVGGHGVDGGLDGPGQPASTWREAEALGRVEPTGDGARFLDDPTSLLDLAAGLGVDEVLVRTSWARFEQREGVLAHHELDRLAALVASARSRGLGVGLVLGDGTLPEWLGPEGWLLPATPRRFAAYATRLLDGVGPIDAVVAFEEPATFAAAGWMLGSAPPFRRAGILDALAALDGMLTSAVMVALCAGDAPVTFLSSAGLLGCLEATLLGQPVPPVEPWAASLLERATARTPGRVARENPQALDWPIAPVGEEIAVPGGSAGALLARLARPAAATSLLGISSGISFRTVAAVIDERGRVSRLRGHRRAERLADLFDEADRARSDGGPAQRVLVGELVDRWRWGSYKSREGIYGVDRLRGRTGADLLDTDAAGVPSRASVATLLAGRAGDA